MGITNPTEEHFERGLWGHDGTQWRKLGLLFGFGERWARYLAATVTVAGTNTLTTTTVPAGQVWVVQSISARNLESNVDIQFELFGGATQILLARFPVPGANVLVDKMPLSMALEFEDYVCIRFLNCAEDDRLRGYVWGYKMYVA